MVKTTYQNPITVACPKSGNATLAWICDVIVTILKRLLNIFPRSATVSLFWATDWVAQNHNTVAFLEKKK